MNFIVNPVLASRPESTPCGYLPDKPKPDDKPCRDPRTWNAQTRKEGPACVLHSEARHAQIRREYANKTKTRQRNKRERAINANSQGAVHA